MPQLRWRRLRAWRAHHAQRAQGAQVRMLHREILAVSALPLRLTRRCLPLPTCLRARFLPAPSPRTPIRLPRQQRKE
eukprot:scaffold6949_cov94-Isochrysis_galbana.AAC.2